MSDNQNDHLLDYDKFPWLIFKIKNYVYAVNTKFVTSILTLPKNITSVPNSPNYIKGIINSRGEILTLLGLRALFSFESVEQEFNTFKTMIDERKNDHINWVIELKNCRKEQREFKLAIDPHKCKFGKWYDKFESDNNVINFQLRKIEEPHASLHALADQAEHCPRNCRECQREECLQVTLDNNLDYFRDQILELLDETKYVFKRHFREIIFTLKNGDTHIGVIVDEISTIKNLNCIYDYKNTDNLYKSKFIIGTANDDNGDLILLLNDRILNSTVDILNIDVDKIKDLSGN